MNACIYYLIFINIRCLTEMKLCKNIHFVYYRASLKVLRGLNIDITFHTYILLELTSWNEHKLKISKDTRLAFAGVSSKNFYQFEIFCYSYPSIPLSFAIVLLQIVDISRA